MSTPKKFNPISSRNWFLIIAAAGMTMGQQPLFAAPWWQFWNADNSTTRTSPAQTSMSTAQEPERITYDKQILAQDRAALDQAYQKLRTDLGAGADTAADRQAIETARKNMEDHLGNLRYDAQAAGVPLPAEAYEGYGRQGGRDHGGWNRNGYGPRGGNGGPGSWDRGGRGSWAQANPSATPEQIQADREKMLQDRNSLYESHQTVDQSRQALRQDYQKLWQDKKAGTDVTADQQAIEKDRAALDAARQSYQTDRSQFRQDRNAVRQDYGAPQFSGNGGYGERRGWRGPDGYNDRPWQNSGNNQPSQGGGNYYPHRHNRY